MAVCCSITNLCRNAGKSKVSNTFSCNCIFYKTLKVSKNTTETGDTDDEGIRNNHFWHSKTFTINHKTEKLVKMACMLETLEYILIRSCYNSSIHICLFRLHKYMGKKASSNYWCSHACAYVCRHIISRNKHLSVYHLQLID